MKLELHIARRYLFSKKTRNAINIISGISACGICVGTLALVCVLSVFNGFQDLIGQYFTAFDPPLKITLAKGKTFEANLPELNKIKTLPEVEVYSEVIEDNVLLRYADKQVPAVLKGVTEKFQLTSGIDSIFREGEFKLRDKYHYFAVMGQGLAYTLGAGVYFIDPLYIYAPKSKVKVNIARPDNAFNQKGMFLSGIFAVNQSEYDSQYVIIDLELAQELFQYENLLTSIEIKLKDGANLERTEKKIQKILGDKFIVQNRHEQKVEFFKMMQIEKWITYLILSFILLIAIFNIIGSLTMLILDKKEDIKTLHSLGANDQTIRRIFLYEGWMISVIGAFIGIAVGVILVLLQQYIGIIRLSGSYVITYYPVRLAVIDLIIIFFTVVGLGFLASYYPTKFINKNKI